MHFGYGAQVRVSPDNNPDSGGGPLRRSPFRLVPADETVMVSRTPFPGAPDPESGWARDPYFDEPRKFLPDGRLVPAGALGAIETYAGEFAGKNLAIFSILGCTLLGFGAAFLFSDPSNRLRNVGFGSLLGFGTGATVAGIAGRSAVLFSRLK
jgi:hypothetical protein